ncbi:MAG: AMP-binding protein, partial [Alphaproteobacteria bacterium]
MNGNLYELFRSRFPADRAASFIETDGGRRHSYAQLEEWSGRFQRLLVELGVEPGDRVAVQAEKSPEAIFLYLACLRAGAVYVPLNPAYRRSEVEYFLADSEPTVVVAAPELEAAALAAAAKACVRHVLTLGQAGDGTAVQRSESLDPNVEPARVDRDQLAALLYTSGTTGRSKGAMMSHGNLASNALALHTSWGFRPGDVLLHALPIYHTHGLFVATHCVLLNGTGMLFLPRFDVDAVVGLLPRATVFMGVPTYYTRLLAHPGLTSEWCRPVRLFISGSAPLLADTFERFRLATGHTILERYGMTEAGMITSNPLDGERVAGSVGPPLPGVVARVADESGAALPNGQIGVLEIKGPNVFRGYWRQAEKTRAEFRPDGFFITGDLARIEPSGYVTLVGRAKDLIISGGLNVYPKEIEQTIDGIDGVAE